MTKKRIRNKDKKLDLRWFFKKVYLRKRKKFRNQNIQLFNELKSIFEQLRYFVFLKFIAYF